MSYCICCQGCLLRHVRHRDIRWYCPSCRQDMPAIDVGDRSSTKPVTHPERVLAARSRP